MITFAIIEFLDCLEIYIGELHNLTTPRCDIERIYCSPRHTDSFKHIHLLTILSSVNPVKLESVVLKFNSYFLLMCYRMVTNTT